MRRMREFLEDDSGRFSSTRLVFVAWGMGVGAIWSVLSIRAGLLLPVPAEIIGILATFGATKVAQKYGETGSKAVAS